MKPTNRLHLFIETGAFFLFSAFLCSLTLLGAAGVDPFVKDAPLMQHTANR